MIKKFKKWLIAEVIKKAKELENSFQSIIYSENKRKIF